MTQTTPLHFERVPLDDVLRKLFAGTEPDHVIGIGMRWPTVDDPDPVPHYYAPVLMRDLDLVLPSIIEATVGETLYMQPNARNIRSIYRNGSVWRHYHRTGTIPYAGGPIYYAAGLDHVESLNAVVIDLDVGKSQLLDDELLTADRTMAMLWSMVEAGELPRPHFIAKSGRGVYIVYLLTADALQPRKPAENTPGNCRIFERIQEELMRRLVTFYPDGIATSTANFYKLPKTLDTKTGNVVDYFLFGPSSTMDYPYFTLAGLAGLLGLSILTTAPPPPATSTISHLTIRVEDVMDFGEDQAVAGLQKGYEGPSGANRESSNRRSSFTPIVDEIERLVAHRQGNMAKCRTMTIFYFHQLVRWEALERLPLTADRFVVAADMARERAAALNESFTVPLKPKAFANALRFDPNYSGRARNVEVSEKLLVTPKEREQLQLKHLDYPPAMLAREERMIEMLMVGARNRDVVEELGVTQMQVSRLRKTLLAEGLIGEMPRAGWTKTK